MRTAAGSLALLLLIPAVAAADQHGTTLVVHLGTVERKAPMRLYFPADQPTLAGVEIATALSDRVAMALDISAGGSTSGTDRRTLFVVSGGILFHSAERSRLTAVAGAAIVSRTSSGDSTLMVRCRLGAALRATGRLFVRPELMLDVGPYFDMMARARIGVGYRF